MAAGKKIENRGHIIGFQEEIESAGKDSPEKFFTWFNESGDINETFVRGAWDFSLHFAYPLAKYLNHPQSKDALEIGYGGGRILASASRHFRKVIGIDIHANTGLVTDELNKRGVINFELKQTDGMTIPIPDNSIDAAYSFIVLQHVEKIDIFIRYIQEAHRVLKPGGIAVLYFGRFHRFSLNRKSKLLYLFDRIAENLFMPKGYLEIPARVNETNLRVSILFARKIAKQTGFQVREILASHRKVPDGFMLFGGQHGMILMK